VLVVIDDNSRISAGDQEGSRESREVKCNQEMSRENKNGTELGTEFKNFCR
jgi:hypothetical protein